MRGQIIQTCFVTSLPFPGEEAERQKCLILVHMLCKEPPGFNTDVKQLIFRYFMEDMSTS